MAYWLFQVNPKKYNINCAIKKGEGMFTLRSHRKHITKDDSVLIYLSNAGKSRGIVATAKVISSPTYCFDENDECWNSDERYCKEYRVKLSYEHLKKPILVETLKNDPKLKNMYFGRQGTNFKVTDEQWYKIQKYMKKM